MAFAGGLSPKTRLIITISISFAFFVAEITGSSTHHAKIQYLDTDFICSGLQDALTRASCRCIPLRETARLVALPDLCR